MKNLIYFFTLLLFNIICPKFLIAQSNFTVQGDFDKFYPVVWQDVNWSTEATELEIARPSVHTNSSWRGSLVAKFRVHTTRWGHGSNFIDADIRENKNEFVADYKDVTNNNSTTDFIIWLRGGGTTYYFNSDNASITSPRIYDGVQNSLPFNQVNGGTHTFKTEKSVYLNPHGESYNHTLYTRGSGRNYMHGYLSIGDPVASSDYKLSVNGTIRSKEIKVETGWADFVFNKDYNLRPLQEVDSYIQQNGHLPEIPTAKEVEENGIGLGAMNAKLLQKIEELTLYTIEQQREIEELKKQNSRIDELEEIIKQLK